MGEVGQLTENDPTEVKYRVGLWEPSGGEHYERLIPLSYPHADIFPICFDVSNEQTFKNVKSLCETRNDLLYAFDSLAFSWHKV